LFRGGRAFDWSNAILGGLDLSCTARVGAFAVIRGTSDPGGAVGNFGGSRALAFGSSCPSSAVAGLPEANRAKNDITVRANRIAYIIEPSFDEFDRMATSVPVLKRLLQWYGSAASRNPSPKKLKASTVMMTHATGSISHG
jgi:hypothetical protein